MPVRRKNHQKHYYCSKEEELACPMTELIERSSPTERPWEKGAGVEKEKKEKSLSCRERNRVSGTSAEVAG